MTLITEVDELTLLDASLKDEVICDLDGCDRAAKFSWCCVGCHSGSLLCPDHAYVVRIKMQEDTARGKIVKCRETGQVGTPVEMLPVLPIE